MSSETLYGLDRPDELADLELKDANSQEIIEATYKIWLKASGKSRQAYHFHNDWNALGQMYKIACNIVSPFGTRLKGSIHTDDFPFMNKMDAGLYLAALLNESGIEKMTVGKFPKERKPHGRDEYYRFSSIGYFLSPDKTVEILRNGAASYVGHRARGGTIVNNANIYTLGVEATGGLFVHRGEYALQLGTGSSHCITVNHGHAYDMGGTNGGISMNFGKTQYMGGFSRKDTINLNFGVVTGSFSDSATGGIHMNFGSVGCIEYDEKPATDSVFIMLSEPEDFQKQVGNGSYHVGPKELETDRRLSDMISDMRIVGSCQRFNDIRALAHCIDEHVRKNYEPRKVA